MRTPRRTFSHTYLLEDKDINRSHATTVARLLMPIRTHLEVLHVHVFNRSRTLLLPKVQVTGQRFLSSSGKGGRRSSYCFEGTFITQDGALFVVPPATRRRRPKFPAPGRNIENWMLRGLFETDMNPLLQLAHTPRIPSTPVAMGCPVWA